MKITSKVIMGATLVMLVSLAIVFGLVLVLLAELCCKLLIRWCQLRDTTSNTTIAATTTDFNSQPQQPQDQSAAAPPLNFHAQGVLRAPRSFLFPGMSTKENKVDIEAAVSTSNSRVPNPSIQLQPTLE